MLKSMATFIKGGLKKKKNLNFMQNSLSFKNSHLFKLTATTNSQSKKEKNQNKNKGRKYPQKYLTKILIQTKNFLKIKKLLCFLFLVFCSGCSTLAFSIKEARTSGLLSGFRT